MKQTRLTHDSLHSHTLSTLHASKKYPNVKTVQLFIQNIDSHIANSYNRLKSSKEKQITITKSSKKIDLSSQGGGSRMQRINKIDLKTNPLIGGGSQYQTPVIKEKRRVQERTGEEDIVLMDNREVMDYINYVYETYNLPDPMERYKDLTKSQLQYETSRKDPKKTDYERFVGSASTLKHSKSPDFELTPFNSSGNGKNQGQDALKPKKKIQIITLRSSTAAKESIIPLKGSSIKLQNSNESKKGEHLFHSKCVSSVSHFSLVPQTYRYCFMCEQPILQTNLLAHEAQCQQLQSAYNHDLPKIIELLDAKIERLGKEVQQTLLNKGEKQIGEEFENIKRSVKSWMQQIPSETVTQRCHRDKSYKRQTGKSYNSHWREQFAKIEDHISSSVCKSFSSLSKLNWFAKLRENIGERYFA